MLYQMKNPSEIISSRFGGTEDFILCFESEAISNTLGHVGIYRTYDTYDRQEDLAIMMDIYYKTKVIWYSPNGVMSSCKGVFIQQFISIYPND